MSSFKKMVLMPEEVSDEENETPQSIQGGQGVNDDFSSPPPQSSQKKGNTIRDYAIDRQRRLLQIVMRIASINGYNEKMNIKDKNGKFVEGTDIIPLILYSVTKERLVKGIDAFVDLLVEAKVPPDVITNENLRQRLINSGHAANRTSSVQSHAAEEVAEEIIPIAEDPIPGPSTHDEPIPLTKPVATRGRKRKGTTIEPPTKVRKPETRSRK